MNYKIKITADNRETVKRIADENGMNKIGFKFESPNNNYLIKNNEFIVYPNFETLRDSFHEITIEQFIELFDKKTETELEKWLRETKAKNLNLYELESEISLLPIELYNKLKWQSNCNPEGKAQILYNQWDTQEPIETEWKPERGDRVLVWDSESNIQERIFIAEIKGEKDPFIVVNNDTEKDFLRGDKFSTSIFKHMKPIPKEEPIIMSKNYLQKLKSVRSCFIAHPDNLPNSEFADRIEDLNEIIDNYTTADFKTKVVELIESEIEDLNNYIEANLKNEFYGLANNNKNKKKALMSVLEQIKELN